MELRRSRLLLADVVSSAVETARPAIDAAGHELTVALPPEPIHAGRRPDPAGAGVRQPAHQQRQVHRPGRAHLAAAARRATRWSVAVRDTGIGIPADVAAAHLRHVLSGRPQHRAHARAAGHRPGAGQGPGRDARRGRQAASGAGRGSTFTVRLPVVETSRRPSRRQREAGAPAPAGRGASSWWTTTATRRSRWRRAPAAGQRRPHRSRRSRGGEAGGAVPPAGHADGRRDAPAQRLRGDTPDSAQPWGRDITVIALTGWGQETDGTARTRPAAMATW